MPDVDTLLPADALHGVHVGVSISSSPDLHRLGLLEDHLRLALAETARAVLVSGGKLAYGGHLQPEGYTAFLINELRRYSRRDRPITLCLAWSEHRRMKLSELERERRNLALLGSITCLNVEGHPVDPRHGRGEEPTPEQDPTVVTRGLTGLRRYMGEITHARILIGGKRSGFQGTMPGLLEEALTSIRLGQPLYIAGGFGGVTLDIIRAVRPAHAEWLPELDGAPPQDLRLSVGLAELIAACGEAGFPYNGLDDQENSRLAATHRPSEIAALLSVGLGRMSARGAPADEGTAGSPPSN